MHWGGAGGWSVGSRVKMVTSECFALLPKALLYLSDRVTLGINRMRGNLEVSMFVSILIY